MKQGSSSQQPKARERQLIVKELPDETLVYDLETDKAHCLNHTAALVWKNCDGHRTVSEIGNSLERELGVPVTTDVVWLALDQLEEFQLLNEKISRPIHLSGMSRRQVMRTLGIATVAIPLITSIVVPTPAQAASCTAPTNRDNDCPCTSSSQCSSGCCRSGQNLCKPGGGSCLP